MAEDKVKKEEVARVGNYVITRQHDGTGWEMFDVFFEQNLTSVSLSPEAFTIVKQLFAKADKK